METKDTLSSCSNSEEQQMQQIQDKAKKSCMVSFRQLHSHLKLLSNNDLKGTRTEYKRAFATLFGQDVETFTGTMLLNMDQLEKQLDNEEFQEIGSMSVFKVLETQFQMFIKSRIYLDDEYVVMTRNYFLQYTQLGIPEFRDTLIDHMESVKKSIDEREHHKQEYDSRFGDTESSGTESKEQDTSSRSGNDEHADDADNRTIYDEELMAEVQTTAEINVFATRQQHTEQPEFNNKGEVDKNAEQCHDTLEAHCVNLELKYQNQALKEGQHGQFSKVKSNESKIKHDIDVIETINIESEHKVAKLLKENETLKSIKNELRKITGNSVNTKFSKQSILGKPVLQPHRNQSVVRQPTAFKSERPRISKPRFASQVDMNNDLSKPVTTHYLPKEREVASVKPHHVIASSNSRNSLKNMPRFSSNDMVHNHYLEKAKKKTQERSRNSRPSVMPSAKSQSTANGSKPKPRSNTQTSRNWPASKSSSVTTKTVPIAEHSRNSRNLTPNILFARHVPSNKTTNKNKLVEQISVAKKPERQISKGHGFSIKKTSVVHKKTMTPRSCLRWKPKGKVSKIVGLRYSLKYSTSVQASVINVKMTFEHNSSDLAPQRQMVSAENNTSGPAPFLNVQMMSVHISSGLVLHQMTSDHNRSELRIQDHSNEQTSSKLVPKVVPLAVKTATSRQELELLFHHHIAMLRTTDIEDDIMEPSDAMQQTLSNYSFS
ncbi:hypothetical protein Tco_0943928 [Tanacetum coccineum]